MQAKFLTKRICARNSLKELRRLLGNVPKTPAFFHKRHGRDISKKNYAKETIPNEGEFPCEMLLRKKNKEIA